MNKIKIISTIVIALSLTLANAATVGFNKSTLNRANSDNDAYLNLSITSDIAVYGLQFEVSYNPTELSLVDVKSLMDGYTFEYRVTEEGTIRGLIFSLQGAELVSESNITNVLEFEFAPGDNHSGSSLVEFNNVILAGQHGEEIDVTASSQEVTFDNALIPTETSLSDNYPNPFNPTTNINYSIAKPGHVSLVIYDLNGSEVRTLVSGYRDAANYTSVWDGTNNQGNAVASGRYILKMTGPDFTDSITMTLLK